jgi:NAD(P)-dependent dehydrogenase (short-subunit alcohol dehydrogenase family)
MTTREFDGKVALVTGGSSGIGRAAALMFAERGARVAVAARRSDEGEGVAHEIAERGGRAIFVRTDVADGAAVERLVERVVAELGRLDCAFNNAATEGVLRPTADVTEEEYDAIMAANLKGVWLCMKHEIRQMLRQAPAGGAVVNTSSVNGLGGVAAGGIYAATKAGVIALTKSAAQEYGTAGIRVNALVAGSYRTPMRDRTLQMVSGGNPAIAAAAEQQLNQLIPLRRPGDPTEAAEVVLWLCSDAASYVTGHSMIADGGMTAWAR